MFDFKLLNLFAGASFALVVGCTIMSPPVAKTELVTCDSGSANSLVGMRLDDLTASSLPANRRVVLSNASLGKSFDPSRMTITVNSSGIVSGVQCG